MPNQIELVPGQRFDPGAALPASPSGPRLKPELLSPAGDRACLLAAVENGADAVYQEAKRGEATAVRAAPPVASGVPKRVFLLMDVE